MAKPGRDAAAELDDLIQRRAAEAEDAAEQNRLEAMWAESERKERDRLRRERRSQWSDFYRKLARSHAAMAADFEARAAAIAPGGAHR